MSVVLIDTPRIFRYPGSTDARYARQLTTMRAAQFRLSTSSMYAARRLAHDSRAGRRPERFWFHDLQLPIGEEASADFVFSNLAFPREAKRPVIWQNTILDPVMRTLSGKHTLSDIEREIRIKGPLFEQARVVVVSTKAEEGRIRELVREVSVVSIPFFLPYLSTGMQDLAVAGKPHARAVSDDFKILFVGRDARRKGLPELLAAVARLTTKRRIVVTAVTDFRDGPVARPSSVDVKVLPPMSQACVMHAMQQHHLLALPSKFEAYGLVLVEAMAVGLPALTCSFENQRELLAGGELGFLWDSSKESLDDAIAEAMDRIDRDALSDRLRCHFESNYSPAVVESRWRDVLRGL